MSNRQVCLILLIGVSIVLAAVSPLVPGYVRDLLAYLAHLAKMWEIERLAKVLGF